MVFFSPLFSFSSLFFGLWEWTLPNSMAPMLHFCHTVLSHHVIYQSTALFLLKARLGGSFWVNGVFYSRSSWNCHGYVHAQGWSTLRGEKKAKDKIRYT
jgi:hypothetical protein